MDMRLPVPYPEGVKLVSSLLSVRKTGQDEPPAAWKGHDIVDMEAHAQADVFRKTDITFHCLKFGTDHADANTISDFNRNIVKFRDSVRTLFGFLDEDRTRVSAIIPVYNRERTIRRAIDSVLAQSYPPAEIIVVDDCSTDATPDILASYGSRIRHIRLARNSGPSAARNTGIRAAESGWVAFLDSDDCWERHKLRRQVEFSRKYPFYQIFQSDEKWIRNGRRVNPRKHHLKPEGWIWERSLHRCLVSPSAVIARRSLLLGFGGFDEEMPACEDYDLWLRISRYYPVGLEPSKSVVKYGGHEDQLSRRIEALDRFRVKSLLRLLECETDPGFREKISAVLTGKFRILADGCRKRGKMLRLDLDTYKISLC
jgi:GT2 family glycosyltransferase